MKKKEKIILTITAFILILLALLGGRTYARFDEEKVSIKIGETKELNVKTNISNYYCTSSNEEVARIINTCDLYGVSVGNAVIIVKAGNLTNKINVSVLDNEKEYFDFNETSHTMNVGDNYKLSYKTNIKNINFKASNDNIVIKDNVVYALKKGKASVIFESNGIYKKLDIVINEKETLYFDFNETSHTMSIGDNYKLSYKTNIKNINFKASNDNIVIKDNVVYALKKGKASVIFESNGIYKKLDIVINEKETLYFDFNETSHTMSIGDNYKLSYKTNIKNINFKASNDNIYIKNGTVYANKAGKAIVKFEQNGLYRTITININAKTITATFDKGNSDGLSEYSKTCQIKEVNGNCNINLPYINYSNNYDIIGFVNGNKTYKPGAIVTIKQNTTFVASVNNKNKITINYIGNGANVSKTSDTCYEASCTLTLPNITREGYEILGYSTSNKYTFAQYKVGETITINQNMNLYAITRKKLYATFLNDNKVTITKPNNYEYINNSVRTYCTIYNTLNSCYITAPTNVSINNNYEFIGFRGDKEYKLGARIYLTQNYVFTPIYKQKEVVYKDITIYVSPNGNDNNNGLSSNYAVKTLDRVQKILKSSTNIKNVYVKIEPGTYYNEHTIWNYYNGHNIRFMSTSTTKPVYKGNNSTLPWFSISLNNTSLVDLKISFYNIKVESYFSGISIIGGPGKIKNVTIENMLFNSIGSKGINTSYTSRECINIKNASNISIINNTFTNLLNNPNETANHAMSAIRLYNTSNSLIKGNHMTNIDGDGIILENASNNNVINTNTFVLTGYLSFITENYYSYYKVCTNNTISNNNFVSGYSGYKVLKTSILEHGTKPKLYYNEDFTNSNKNFYNNLGYTLIRSNYTNRFKIS